MGEGYGENVVFIEEREEEGSVKDKVEFVFEVVGRIRYLYEVGVKAKQYLIQPIS